jgi:hypothetical protein
VRWKLRCRLTRQRFCYRRISDRWNRYAAARRLVVSTATGKQQQAAGGNQFAH